MCPLNSSDGRRRGGEPGDDVVAAVVGHLRHPGSRIGADVGGDGDAIDREAAGFEAIGQHLHGGLFAADRGVGAHQLLEEPEGLLDVGIDQGVEPGVVEDALHEWSGLFTINIVGQRAAAYGPAMIENPQSDEPTGARFVDADLRGARFVRSDLTGAVMRGVCVAGGDIDGEIDGLRVNGVEVLPLVETELNRRFPGREGRRATDPDGLRENWAALERTWAATLERVAEMPEGTVDVSVDGEWSFAQTLRHLVLATDAWLRGAILGVAQPFHPIGQPFAEYETDGFDMSIFTASTPSMRKCSTCAPATSPWCATTSRRSRRKCSTRRGPTRGRPPTT